MTTFGEMDLLTGTDTESNMPPLLGYPAGSAVRKTNLEVTVDRLTACYALADSAAYEVANKVARAQPTTTNQDVRWIFCMSYLPCADRKLADLQTNSNAAAWASTSRSAFRLAATAYGRSGGRAGNRGTHL